MNNKKLVAQILATTTLASSAFVAAAPIGADAATQTSALNLVKKAEALASKLKQEVNVDYRKTAYPKDVYGYPNMKLYNETSKAVAAANAAVKTLKGKEKDVLAARLQQNAALQVSRAVAYIDAVSAGKKIQKLAADLDAKVKAGALDASTEQAYHTLTYQIKTQSKALWKVYGKTTRDSLLTAYQGQAYTVKNQALYPVSLKMELDRLDVALAANDLDNAIAHVQKVNALFAEGQQKSLLTSASAAYKSAQARLVNTVTLVDSTSKDEKNPTTFGPANGNLARVISGVAILLAGKDEFTKLQNVTVNGSVYIDGDKTGSGTVLLDSVKVNAVNGKGGSIVVADVADHSLRLTNTEATSLVVADPNGANIVAGQGTKLTEVTVSSNAGQATLGGNYGDAAIVSQSKSEIVIPAGAVIKNLVLQAGTTVKAEPGAVIEAVTLAVTTAGEKVTFSGDFSKTVVTANNANAEIAVAKGSTVAEIMVAAGVIGTLKLENNGTVAKVDPAVTPTTPTTPTTPPVVVGPVTPTTPVTNVDFTTGTTVSIDVDNLTDSSYIKFPTSVSSVTVAVEGISGFGTVAVSGNNTLFNTSMPSILNSVAVMESFNATALYNALKPLNGSTTVLDNAVNFTGMWNLLATADNATKERIYDSLMVALQATGNTTITVQQAALFLSVYTDVLNAITDPAEKAAVQNAINLNAILDPNTNVNLTAVFEALRGLKPSTKAAVVSSIKVLDILNYAKSLPADKKNIIYAEIVNSIDALEADSKITRQQVWNNIVITQKVAAYDVLKGIDGDSSALKITFNGTYTLNIINN